MTLKAQAQTTPGFSSPASPQVGDSASTAAGDLPAAGLIIHSTPPVETTTESPQPAPVAIITANPLTMAILAFVILSSTLILLRELVKRLNPRNPLKGTSKNRANPSVAGRLTMREPVVEKGYTGQQDFSRGEKAIFRGALETIQNQMKKQQNLLQFMEKNQQTLLQKMEDMERSIKRMERLQTVSTDPPPRAIDNPQPTSRLSPADHLVQVLEQGGDRAALAQWPAAKVKVTAVSQDRTYRGDIAGVELEPAQAGASFLVFQVNGENLLVPNQETLGVFQRYQRGHTGLFDLRRQPSRPAPQVSKPARVQPQGRLWRVVEQGEVLIRG